MQGPILQAQELKHAQSSLIPTANPVAILPCTRSSGAWPSQNRELVATIEDMRSVIQEESMQQDDTLPEPIMEDVDKKTEEAYQRQDLHIGDGSECQDR